MKVCWPVEIAGTGMCVGATRVTNADFEKRLDTSDEWIAQRTGIRERRFVTPPESTLSLARVACEGALRDARLDAKDIDLLICATITPEHTLPTTSCELQGALGCRQIAAFDQVVACTGFVAGVLTAAQFIQCGMAQRALVVGAETMTRITDMQDRSTAVLFGDGAGAAVVQRSTAPGREILAASLGADGSNLEALYIPAGGAREPITVEVLEKRRQYVQMNGREVYKFAVSKMQEIMEQTLADAGVRSDEVALVIPHQSNRRIIESACQKLHLPLERVAINIDRFGNMSAASIAVALHEMRAGGRIKPGDLVLMLAFGAGLTWGSCLLRM